LERVGQARHVVVALRVDEDLCLVLQSPERLRVQDAIAVPFERRAVLIRQLRSDAPAAAGVPTVVTSTLMSDFDAARRLAETALEAAA